MPRTTKEDKRREIAQAALSAFSEKGYRLTQVADVAKLAGVAAGTIYLFAKRKEDLFWLALKFAVGRPLVDNENQSTSSIDLRAEFEQSRQGLNLRRVLDSRAELPSLMTVVEDHWDSLSRSAAAIRLIERCARDWPELSQAFYGELRKSLISDLGEYLQRAGEAGLCRRLPNPDLAARMIMETVAWFAMHRMGDADGRHISDQDARAVTIDALIHAYGLPPAALEIA